MGKILRSPVLLFVLFALGILVGILQPPFIGVLEVFGDIFLTMLELCMLLSLIHIWKTDNTPDAE